MASSRMIRSIFAAAAAMGLLLGSAWAQSYPSGTVKLVVGYGPGGGNDIVARILAEDLSKLWNQPVVVENKPGANGSIASTHVARSAPDGHTLLVTPPTTLMIDALWRPGQSIDPDKDLKALSGLASTPFVLTVNARSPIKNVQELVALAKQKNGELNYGWGNPGMRIATELISRAAGVKMFPVGYKSAGQSVPALIGGEIELLVIDSGPVAGLVKAGKVKALAVTTPSRSSVMPEVPTLREGGIDFDWTGFIALYGPPNLPAAVQAKIQSDVAMVLNRPEIRSRLSGAGLDPSSLAQKELDQYLKNVNKRITAVMNAPGFSIE